MTETFGRLALHKRPTDRLPPGQGVIPWSEVFGLLAEKGYTGLISYEAPNPALWARSPYEVCREGFELTKALIDRATRHGARGSTGRERNT